jgi:hypothetical protein
VIVRVLMRQGTRNAGQWSKARLGICGAAWKPNPFVAQPLKCRPMTRSGRRRLKRNGPILVVIIGGLGAEEPDHWHRALLRPRHRRILDPAPWISEPYRSGGCKETTVRVGADVRCTALVCKCRVGPGNFTLSRSQIPDVNLSIHPARAIA